MLISRHVVDTASQTNNSGVDQLLADIADYVVSYDLQSPDAVKNARYSLLDALGCALLALSVPEARTLLGPVVPGAHGGVHGCHVPGTSFSLDPVSAAFSTGALVSWLDYNDCWLGAEWIHPSDALCAILAVADYASSVRRSRGAPPLLMRDVLVSAVKAFEIAGLLAADHSLNAIGVDGTLFTKVAATACCTRLLGGGRAEVAAAASHAFVDGSGLRCFRHAPAGSTRKGWAAADAGSRAVWLALAAMRGEPGIPLALSAPIWGFQDVFYRRAQLLLSRPLGEHVAPRLLFRAALPAEPHAAAAAEAGLALHPLVVHRLDEVQSVSVHTSRAGVRAADRTGPLPTSADRDHCMQYCVAVALVYGCVTAEHFGDAVAGDPRLEELRRRIGVAEHAPFTAEYADPELRAVPAAVQVHFSDRTATLQVTVRCPLGHFTRRSDGLPALEAKLLGALRSRFTSSRADSLYALLQDAATLDGMPVPDFLELLQDPPPPYSMPAYRGADGQGAGDRGGSESQLPIAMSALGLSAADGQGEGAGEAEMGEVATGGALPAPGVPQDAGPRGGSRSTTWPART